MSSWSKFHIQLIPVYMRNKLRRSTYSWTYFCPPLSFWIVRGFSVFFLAYWCGWIPFHVLLGRLGYPFPRRNACSGFVGVHLSPPLCKDPVSALDMLCHTGVLHCPDAPPRATCVLPPTLPLVLWDLWAVDIMNLKVTYYVCLKGLKAANLCSINDVQCTVCNSETWRKYGYIYKRTFLRKYHHYTCVFLCSRKGLEISFSLN